MVEDRRSRLDAKKRVGDPLTGVIHSLVNYVIEQDSNTSSQQEISSGVPSHIFFAMFLAIPGVGIYLAGRQYRLIAK